MKKDGTGEPKEETPFLMFIEDVTYKWLVKNVVNSKRFTVISSIVILISIAATNLLTLTIIPDYLYFVAAAPAAVASVLLAYYYLEIVHNQVTTYKSIYLPKERIRNGIIAAASSAGLLVILNITTPEWLTMGVGGVLLIVASYFIAISIGKTEAEHRYNKMGIVDPREEV
jgi:hypothetical protein